jgi:hypothetical protein
VLLAAGRLHDDGAAAAAPADPNERYAAIVVDA